MGPPFRRWPSPGSWPPPAPRRCYPPQSSGSSRPASGHPPAGGRGRGGVYLSTRKLGPRDGRKEPSPADGLQVILGAEEGVAFPQPGPLRLHVVPIGGVVFGHLSPVKAEVPLYPILSFQLQVRLFGCLQKAG